MPSTRGDDETIGQQIFVWDSESSQIYTAGTDDCLTVGKANEAYAPNNNGTLEQENWAGPLTPDPTTGEARKVVALFNKGLEVDAIFVPADVLGTDKAIQNVTVRDVDLPDLAPGSTLGVNVGRHGVSVLVLTGV